MELIELAEPAWGPMGMHAIAKRDILEGTPVLKITGLSVKSPSPSSIQINTCFHLSAENALWGSIGHSCNPNCAINFNTWTFHSTRKIEDGEELTYDYLTTEWEMAAPFACTCGAKNCHDMISGFKHLPHPRQEEMALYASPFLLRQLFELAPLRDAGPADGRQLVPRTAVYVFIPYTLDEGSITSFDYDFPSFRAEVQSWFSALDLPWRWVPITLENLDRTIESLQRFGGAGSYTVLNLCDGCDIDASPGVSVVRALEKADIPFTGGCSHFYQVTTPKVLMKRRLAEKGVPTPAYAPLRDLPQDILCLEKVVGYPVLIKPEISAGSNGISLKSLVHDARSAEIQIARLFREKDGEFYRSSGVFAERFVDGPEFTVLVVGNHDQPEKLRAFPPAERVFHSALPSHERFLSFDRYWSEYKEEPRLPQEEPFYRYALAPASIKECLAALALRAFITLGGSGYARIDIRMDNKTGELYVLEVNSNCGLSGDRETSVGEILHLTGTPIYRLISEILQAARDRWQTKPSRIY